MAFQIWTKCVENKWEGNRVSLGEGKLECFLAKELYFTFCVMWGSHVQNLTTQTF